MLEEKYSKNLHIVSSQKLKERDYWLTKLSGDLVKSSFPYDFNKTAPGKAQKDSFKFKISDQLFSRLKWISNNSDIRLFVILVSALNVLIGKYSYKDGDDIIVGTSIYKQDMEGEFVNTVIALRNQLHPNMTVKELLFQVSQTLKAAVENQNYPIETLLYQLNIPFDENNFPLFDIVILLENIHDKSYIEHINTNIILSFLKTGTCIEGEMEYNPFLFEKSTIERTVNYFILLLQEIVFDVDKVISSVGLLSKEEKRRILFELDCLGYPADKNIRQLFEERVTGIPDNVAVIGTGKGFGRGIHLTYRQLNEIACQLAHLLWTKGVNCETIAAIMVERSIEMIWGILGILKAGAVYMPIDPDYPAERIKYMIEDSGTTVLLTGKQVKPKMEVKHKPIYLEEMVPDGKNMMSTTPERNNHAGNPAYIIYTSGTTGKSKGVLIEHRNVVRLLFNDGFLFDFGSKDIWTMFHSYCFDFSVWEMYGALLYGGKLVLVEKMVAMDPELYLQLLKEYQVTVLNQTPTVFYHFVEKESNNKSKHLNLKYVIFGGEALKPVKLKAWKDKYPSTKLVNMFGITETTVHVTFKEITEREIRLNISNIGRPLPTLKIYVMDRYQKPLPIGIPGELVVTGEGLGRGYLNRVELTAERFVADLNDTGARGYLSGDLVRWLENGEMEYLGRIDQQLQLKGFRIEPGEIEYRLLRHGEIKEAVVLAKRVGGEQALCAYIVSGSAIKISELREYLSACLPDYMIPAYFVRMEGIPLTSNGKVDRRALPEPEAALSEDYVAPRNDIEKKLAELWEDVLGIKDVGIKDSFFDVGGDSIRAIRLLNNINKELNTHLRIVDIFTGETIEKLALTINRRSTPANDSEIKRTLKEIETLKDRILQKNEKILTDIEDIYPMSDIEKGMIFHSLEDPLSAVYHDQIVNYVRYIDFDPGRFKEAFLLLVEKHSILRTAFDMDSYDEPVQIVYKGISPDVEHYDISDMKAKKQDEYLENLLMEDRKKCFVPGKVPLWRLKTFCLGSENICIVLVLHHAILDGWSVSSLMTELNNTYLRLKTNPGYIPAKLKNSYKAFIVEQMVEKGKPGVYDYWKRELGSYKRLKLPLTPHFTGKDNTLMIKHFNASLGEKMLGELQTCARKYNATVKNLCFGAFCYMLSMLSHENDFVVGMVTNNRPVCEDGEKILGCFLNTVPIRMRIPGGITWRDYIHRVNRKLLEVKEYERLSLFRITKIIGESAQSENPIFDMMFNFIEFHVYRQLSGSSLMDYAGPRERPEGFVSTKTFFNFNVNTTFGSFDINIRYTYPLFDNTLIETLFKYFEKVLHSFLNEPEGVVRKENVISLEERQRLLEAFNLTGVDYPKDRTVHRWFEETAARAPDKVAVVSGDMMVTYRELNAGANRLAGALRNKGVGASRIVPLVVDPSIEMISGILAVLKAGGAYLPIEPEFPEKKINYMLSDNNAGLVLARRCLIETLRLEREVIFMDNVRGFGVDGKNLKPVSSSPDPAYVIYTSGTTGKPKGVLLKNENLVNYVSWLIKEVNLESDDRAILTSSFAFDLGYSSIYPSLLWGCELHLVPREVYLSPESLLSYIWANGITYMKLTPSLLKTIIHSSDFSRETCAGLRFLLVGGEPIDLKDVERLNAGAPHINIINHYGPTETTIGSVSRLIDFSAFDEYRMNPTIGKPIHNTGVYILDNHLDVLPVGVAGELCIGGDGVGVGYLNRPELTSGRFIPRRLNKKRLRLYKTGDLAWWLWDGNIEFLGRIDTQVKVRGYRIELGEIENRLLGHPAIRDAAVIARADKKGGKYLAAYVVTDEGVDAPEPGKIREYLSTELSEYMIPSYIIPLAELPLTPNGKVDRKALPEVTASQSVGEENYTAPRNEIEKILAEIWENVLDHDRIGVNENFFLRGGDSIKAIQIVSRLNKTGYKATIKDIFRNPSISGLAPLLKKSTGMAEQSVVKGMIPLTPIQKEFFSRLKIDCHHYNQAVMLHSPEGIEEEAVKTIFKKIQEHHDALRMTYKESDGVIVQTNHGMDYPLSLKIYDFRGRENPGKALEAAANEIHASIHLENGPLMKLGLFRSDDGDRLLIVIHHLVVDTVSWRILLEDIEILYQRYRKGDPLALPGKTDSFKRWAEQLTWYANSEEFLKEKHYWKKLESTTIPPLEKDFEETNNYVKDTGTVSFRLKEEETDQLLTKVNHAFGTEINDILLAALSLGARKAFGTNGLLIAMEGHGREEIFPDVDISRTVGWFTSVFPVYMEVDSTHNLALHLKTTKERLRQIPNKGIGYGILKYLTDVAQKKDMAFRLNPRISFNYLGQFDADMRSSSLGNAEEAPGHSRSLDGKRKFELEILGMVIDNKLEISIIYNERQYKRETLKRFLACCREQLENIISFCQARDRREPTPSDFTYKGLSIDTVDFLCRQYPIEDIYTLTPTQEGMLFHSLYESSSAYFVQISFRFCGSLDIPLVEKSLNRLFKRYDILRTAFFYKGLDRPVQLVLKKRNVDFFFQDIREMASESEKKTFIEEYKINDRKRSFDLSRDILLRVAVLRVSDTDFEFIWSNHHILMDGWCRGILNSEFFEIYYSYLEGRPSRLPGIKPYRIYVEWLERQDKEKAGKYWNHLLEGYNKPVGIPRKSNLQREGQEYRREEIVFTYTPAKTNALNKFSAKNKVTPGVVLQTIWGLLLARYNNVCDVVFGMVISGRPPEIDGVESMVGLFINTIPVRIRFDEDLKFFDLAREVQKESLESEPYHYYSLAEIQSETSFKQNLIDHFLTFMNYPNIKLFEEGDNGKSKVIGDAGLEISEIQHMERSNYHLDVLIDSTRQLLIKFRYNTNVYDGNFMRKLGGHIEEIITQIVENIDLKIGDVVISHDRLEVNPNIPIEDDSDFEL